MKQPLFELTKYAMVAGLALSFCMPALAQETDGDRAKRLTPEERQAQREVRRREFLENNPELAKRLEEQRKEREARRAEFLKNNPDVAKRLEERRKEREARREEMRVDREAARIEREQRLEDFLANNPETAEEIQQRWEARRAEREEFLEEHPELAERLENRPFGRPFESRGFSRGDRFNRGGFNRRGR
jgi:hypothetical protein